MPQGCDCLRKSAAQGWSGKKISEVVHLSHAAWSKAPLGEHLRGSSKCTAVGRSMPKVTRARTKATGAGRRRVMEMNED